MESEFQNKYSQREECMKNTKNFMCALLICAFALAVIGIGASAKNAYAQNDSGNSALVSVYKNENVKMINAPTLVCDVTGKAVLYNTLRARAAKT